MKLINKFKFEIILGDITTLKCDAIVNAANPSLMGGGGVDGAIHRSGGKTIIEECKEIIATIGSCRTSQAVITNSGNLPCKKVIHTVGPIWYGGDRNEENLLKDCYINSLKIAEENKINTIAFPNISTGVYGYPKEPAAKVALQTVDNFMSETDEISSVIFVCFDKENFNIYYNLIVST